MPTISVRLNDADANLIRSFAKQKNISVSNLIREAVIERIEDEFDRKAFDEAMEEFKKNPVTYTLDEVEKELGLA